MLVISLMAALTVLCGGGSVEAAAISGVLCGLGYALSKRTGVCA